MIARRLRISGRVQGVWYRDWAVQTARTMGITGWVRNRSDGTVEALAIGSGADVARFVAACEEGSPKSKVSRVAVDAAEAEPLAGFVQLPTL